MPAACLAWGGGGGASISPQERNTERAVPATARASLQVRIIFFIPCVSLGYCVGGGWNPGWQNLRIKHGETTAVSHGPGPLGRRGLENTAGPSPEPSRRCSGATCWQPGACETRGRGCFHPGLLQGHTQMHTNIHPTCSSMHVLTQTALHAHLCSFRYKPKHARIQT